MMLNHDERQQPGLGGALLAAYGVVPETRDIRVSRSFGRLITNVLRNAFWAAMPAGRRTVKLHDSEQ